ncbi:hypothetical protein [Niabella hibiscisoli]|uniref:hypothetical protein n=1 Tax=Niabella hibiscisoli TaxID=1825928 RepID=UPI001F0FC781|nr:hypothetical protein [Niabella hibiscisoli]MCH5715576.1 hypothetical protein [Niabella hibiscisoli]
MNTELYDLKTNIKIGQEIFQRLPNDIRPGWAGLVLSRFNDFVENNPSSVTNLFSIIDNKDRWKEAHQQFTQIRTFALSNKDYKPDNYLRLAELVAKVTYNASGLPAPFDSDSGHHIASLALHTAAYFDDTGLEEEVRSTILVFNGNKKFRNNLTTNSDFLLYKKIDDILWSDWDPLGINDIAPRDEYKSYVPEVFDLLKTNPDKHNIANRLYKLQTDNMGTIGTLENCLAIAEKILRA